MNISEQIRSYAGVLLEVGVELHKGQPLCIDAPVAAEEFVTVLAEEAWKRGCEDVEVLWNSSVLERKELCYTVPKSSPGALAAAEYMAEKGAAYIRLDSPEFFEDQVPLERLRQRAQANAAVRSIFRKKGNGAGRTLACVPGQGWADRVFGDFPAEKRLEKLWEAVLYCSYCDQPDPVAVWREYLEATAQRKALLDERHYQAFHYVGPGTDLTFRAADGDFWKGSCVRTGERISVPNIPTQEVFISPHKLSANGRIAVTKPLNFGGELIEGISLVFDGGRVVKWSAERGQSLLDNMIGTDEGSCYLGEAALVNEFSPIARTGRLFYTTLYDENASCHIALGSTIGPPFDPQEKEKRGFNTSSIHVDMMVGSEKLTIRGQLPNGKWEEMLADGRLVV
ncbi:MAG: aminopeptidase [Lachnospiraceae bacterium]|nr:aminopeptidase [Lachnospiraceae bacterium]